MIFQHTQSQRRVKLKVTRKNYKVLRREKGQKVEDEGRKAKKVAGKVVAEEADQVVEQGAAEEEVAQKETLEEEDMEGGAWLKNLMLLRFRLTMNNSW